MSASIDPGLLAGTIYETVRQVMQSIAGVKFVSDRQRGDFPAGSAIQFDVAGDLLGRIIISFEAELADVLAARLMKHLGINEVMDDELEPALSELANILLGHIDGMLADMGVEGTISIPMAGGDPPDSDAWLGVPISLIMSCAEGAMGIRIFRLRREEEQAEGKD